MAGAPSSVSRLPAPFSFSAEDWYAAERPRLGAELEALLRPQLSYELEQEASPSRWLARVLADGADGRRRRSAASHLICSPCVARAAGAEVDDGDLLLRLREHGAELLDPREGIALLGVEVVGDDGEDGVCHRTRRRVRVPREARDLLLLRATP